MKAIVHERYGPPDVLQLKEVAEPTPKENEALVEVQAASVNYSDWVYVRGKPFAARLMGSGLLKPKTMMLGADVAGQIKAVGESARQFQPGDEVYGDLSVCGWGGFAEYVAVPESALALKPANLTFEEAAAVPQAAVVALQGLRDKGQIQPGKRVLINGASGGIGTFAVQIAKFFGAEVTGVCSTRNLDLVRSIGADEVIDYTQKDFTKSGQRYDLILDIKAYRSLSDYEHALSPKGMYVLVGGSVVRILQASMSGNERMVNFQVRPSPEDLVFMKELIEASKVVPVIDRRFPFSEVAEAVRYYGEGHARGKVVITV
ncbi:MAG TPA: NAD(P)-dependent alcohol dehydrogenase [Anaerolineae bacterium]|nr:NAD(P)-dependent alcohol dehydrogenase [Anaerolineae bacterium]